MRLFVFGAPLVAFVAWPVRHRRVRQVLPLITVPALDAFDDNFDDADDWEWSRVMRRLAVAVRQLQLDKQKARKADHESLRSTAVSRGDYLVTVPPAVAAARPHSRMYEAEIDPREIEIAAILIQFRATVQLDADEQAVPEPPYRKSMYRDAGLHVLFDIIRDVIDR